MYTIYNPTELFDKLNSSTEENEDVIKFFKNFTFDYIVQQNIAKTNSTYVFKNIIKENSTKSKIIRELNKLNPQTLQKVISAIREIIFQTEDELNDLVFQCIQKIKKDNEQIRPLVAALCSELITTYFITQDKDKIYFRKLLLNEVKKEYYASIDYNSDNWTPEKGKMGMILLGTLYNSKILDNNIILSIINDFINKIEFKENGNQEDYEKVEKAIQQLSCLISCIILSEETKTNIYRETSRKILDEESEETKKYKNVKVSLDAFLEEQMEIYEKHRCISKKIRAICRIAIIELRK